MLRTELSLPGRATGLVVRPRCIPPSSGKSAATGADGTMAVYGSDGAEVLVFFSDRIQTLEGGFGARPFRMGPTLRLTDAGSSRSLHRLCDSTPCAIYEPYTRSVLFVEGYGIMRIDPWDNTVSLLAGHATQCAHEDGAAAGARFQYIRAMAADGRGHVYAAETGCIRKLTLAVRPPSGNGGGGGGGGVYGTGVDSDGRYGDRRLSRSWSGESSHSSSSSFWLEEAGEEVRVGGRGGGGAAAVVCTEVATVPGSTPPRDRWHALSYDEATDCLLAATDTAVFRLPPRQLAAGSTAPSSTAPVNSSSRFAAALVAARHASTQDADSPEPTAVLLAGSVSVRGAADGSGSAARFAAISALLATGDGGAYVADGTAVRELDVRIGEVRTVLAEGSIREESQSMSVLPHGCLAVCGSAFSPHVLVFLGQGFRPAAAAAVPPPPSLVRPLAVNAAAPPRLCRQLLEPPAGAAATVVVVRVGEMRLVVHRAVLCAGSDYFRQLLEGGFMEAVHLSRDGGNGSGGGGGAAAAAGAALPPEVELPETDPDAFAALVCYLYTGSLEVSEPLLRPAAELAGRLLMGAASSELQRRLLAVATPETVVADLVWAERHHLAELTDGLVSYFVANCRRVAATAAAEAPTATEVALTRLAASCPGLAARLLLAVSALRW